MKIPSVGRVLHYFGKQHQSDDQPQLAMVAFVHNDRCVNIALFDAHGNVVTNPPLEVLLLQDGDVAPSKTVYCMWPPYVADTKPVEAKPQEKSAPHHKHN